MNTFRLAVDTVNNGQVPKDYREVADLWVRMNPKDNIPAFQDSIRASRLGAEENIKRFHQDKKESSGVLGMRLPAGLIQFLEQYDEDVLLNDKKYAKLKKQLPMLCVEFKKAYV